MSREDAWSVAVTLVISGIVYFAGSRNAALGCLALGFIIVVILNLTRKNKA